MPDAHLVDHARRLLLVGSDGEVWAFRDATNQGSTRNITLNYPIVGMALNG